MITAEEAMLRFNLERNDIRDLPDSSPIAVPVGDVRAVVKLIASQAAELRRLRGALQEHHNWQLNNPIADKEYGFPYNVEYVDSSLFEKTTKALFVSDVIANTKAQIEAVRKVKIPTTKHTLNN